MLYPGHQILFDLKKQNYQVANLTYDHVANLYKLTISVFWSYNQFIAIAGSRACR